MSDLKKRTRDFAVHLDGPAAALLRDLADALEAYEAKLSQLGADPFQLAVRMSKLEVERDAALRALQDIANEGPDNPYTFAGEALARIKEGK